jgi:hypothetical protein
MVNRALAFVLIIVITSISVKAQVSGFNMLEYQNGTLPEDTTKNYSTVFNKFHLNYVSENLFLYGRLETFNSPVDERNYNKITKYGAEYTDKGLTLKIGTFNETLAKGVLLRSYEIPAAVLEDKGFRVRQSFNRDILGIAGKYNSEHFGISLLRGSPLLNQLPPTFPENERRPNIIEAVRSNVSWFNQSFEIGLLRNIENQTATNYPWLAINGVVDENYSYFILYTHQTDTFNEFTIINMQESYGFYSSFGASFNTLSFNLELKNYSNLVLGSGYNDPPALIKEHSSRLLNRSSHVLLPQNEKGYQFDVFYSFPDDSRLNFNNSLAINEFSSKYVYTSYYLEYYKPFEIISFKLFSDYSNDEFKQEKNRITAGGVFDVNIQSFFGEIQYEHQQFERYETSVYNRVISIELGKSPKYAVGSTLELSNDPFQLMDDKSTRTWLGFYGRFKYSRNNNFQLFAGQRRGGPACTAGICYEVLDFEGVELRWNAKF